MKAKVHLGARVRMKKNGRCPKGSKLVVRGRSRRRLCLTLAAVRRGRRRRSRR